MKQQLQQKEDEENDAQKMIALGTNNSKDDSSSLKVDKEKEEKKEDNDLVEEEEEEEENEKEQEELRLDLTESAHKEDVRAILEALRDEKQELEEIPLAIDPFWKEKTLLPTPPNHEEDHSIIHVLTEEMLAQENISNYMEEFELLIPKEEVLVGSISLEEIHQKEIEIEKAKAKEIETQLKQFQLYQKKLKKKEKEIHQRLVNEANKKHLEMVEKKRQFLETMQWRTKQMKYCFLQAEKQFKTNLQFQQVQVEEVYGHLEKNKKRYRLQWKEIPLTIQIQAKCLRGLKDKSPKGQYVLLTTLYDRLGGHPLQYTKVSHTKQTNLTRPFYHKGRFYDIQVDIQQKMFIVCPPVSLLRPGQVLIFEMFLLGGRHHSYNKKDEDQVIAWGALPLCTPDFQVLEGSYKIPLIRGEMDPTIDKYDTLEQMIQQDLTTWLCHLYVDIQHTKDPKSSSKEYDVEIDELNQLLKMKTFEGSQKKATSISSSSSLHLRKNTRQKHKQQQDTTTTNSFSHPTTSPTGRNLSHPTTSPTGKSFSHPTCTKKNLWTTFFSSCFFWKRAKIVVTNENFDHEQTKDNNCFSTSEEEEEEEEEEEDNKEVDVFFEQSSHQKRPLSLNLDKYTFSINKTFSIESVQHQRFYMSRKLFYLQHELFMDLGFHQWYLVEFWIMLGLFVFALWWSMYIHYLGQWLFLKSLKIPVYDFLPQITTCSLKYTWQMVSTQIEIGLILIGTFSNFFFFSWIALIAMIFQKFIGEIPSFGSKWIVCIGITSILDPLLIFLLDLIHQHYDCLSNQKLCIEGDAFKLYRRFRAQEGSGIVGIVLTLILYSAMICMSTWSLYMYLLYCHMNGRMLDVYRRIHQQETSFFVPHDLELSLNELKNICQQAKRWKGPKGNLRKVFIHEYLLQDPFDVLFQEKSVHIVIYTMNPMSMTNNTLSNELYRHFIKSADGSIIELFGEMNQKNKQWEQMMHALATREETEGSTEGGMGFLNAILKDCYEEDLGGSESGTYL